MDKYIWLLKGECVHIFSAAYHYVSQIEYGSTKDNTIVSTSVPYKNEINSQIKACDKLAVIMASLKENSMIQYNGLIHYDKFVLPSGMEHLLKESGTTTNTTKTSVIAGYNTAHRPYTAPHQTNTYKRKEVSTGNFKRTTRYPVANAIEVMNNKFKEIKDGEYVPPKLSKIPADSMDMNAEGDKKDTNFNDDYYGMC